MFANKNEDIVNLINNYHELEKLCLKLLLEFEDERCCCLLQVSYDKEMETISCAGMDEYDEARTHCLTFPIDYCFRDHVSKEEFKKWQEEQELIKKRKYEEKCQEAEFGYYCQMRKKWEDIYQQRIKES